MKKLLVILVFLLFLVSCNETTTVITMSNTTTPDVNLLEDSDLTSDYVMWYGRHQTLGEQVYFYYTATGFRLSFYGSALNITLALEDKNEDIYFSLAEDDELLVDAPAYVLSDSQQTFSLRFDTYANHTIELVKRSEPQDGVTSLVSLETNGHFLVPEPNPPGTPHFLLIGASGISGNGAIGLPGQPRTTANSSSIHSFGYLTAALFGGTYEFVSNSGWGLAFGFNDRTGEENIQRAYESIGIDASEHVIDAPYDHSVIPDIIIVNIGGNDYSAVINRLTGFEKEEKIAEFKQAVADFILKLRSDAPNAHIFWTMTDGSLNGTAASNVINLLPETDKQFVHVVVINGVGENGPVGANNHSSYETHENTAQILMQAIEEYTSYLPID